MALLEDTFQRSFFALMPAMKRNRIRRQRYVFILAAILAMAFQSSFTVPLSAQPAIDAVTANADTAGLYEKLELTIDLTASYTNPFDPEDIILWTVFTSPTAEEWSVNGFWDGSDWRVRFAAGDTGSWSYTVYVDDGTGRDSSTVGSFYCRLSPYRGWLQVSPDDPHFLQHHDGSPFFGIGQCRCWFLDDVPTILDDMREHGMNLLVYWMPSWDDILVTLASGYDHYDTDHAADIDTVVDDCETHDISLALTVWNHDELRGAGHPWPRKYFDDYNPFHDLTDATGFMTDSTSWAYQEKLYRYIIARWGYSRAIGLWHTVCEIDGTTNSYNNDAVTDPWHVKIDDYFKDNDPFGHPTTASKSAGSVWNWPTGFGVMDCPQAHVYEDGVGISNTIATRTRTMWEGHEQPNFIGEFGANYGTAPTVKHLHDGIWAGLAAGGAIAPLDWNDGDDWGDLTAEMYDHQQYLADFIFGLPLDRMGLNPLSVTSDAEFQAWGMAGDQVGYFWIQDVSPGEINSGTEVTLSGLTAGQWSFDWYDTWAGAFLPDRAVETAEDGSINGLVPDFTDDIACRFHRAGDFGQTVVHLNPIGDVTTWPGTPYRWKDIADHVYAQGYQDTFTYDRPRVTTAFDPYGQTFRGRLRGYGLKPNFAYQMKLVGKPTGLWGQEADDQANEYIGYEGRWWREQPNPGNTNDADYQAHKDDSTYIFVGYLLFDYFVTDEYGHAEKEFQLNSSYHVLWNTVLNARDPGPNDSPITDHTVRATGYHPAYDTAHAPAEVGLYAEWEPGRDLPGEVILPAWMYHLQFILTEESFHQSGIGGYWAGAMGCDSICFSVPDTALSPDITAILPDVGSMSLRLEWTAISEATFNVYRDTIPDFSPAVPLASGLVETTYADTTAIWLGYPGRSFYYAVTAVTVGKESAPSGHVGEFDVRLENFKKGRGDELPSSTCRE
jgi:hypothetical protein